MSTLKAPIKNPFSAVGSAEYHNEAARLAPYERLARLVIEHRIANGLSQEQLAARVKTSVSAISRLESGQHRPNLDTLQRLAEAFGANLVVGFETKGSEPETVLSVVSRRTGPFREDGAK